MTVVAIDLDHRFASCSCGPLGVLLDKAQVSTLVCSRRPGFSITMTPSSSFFNTNLVQSPSETAGSPSSVDGDVTGGAARAMLCLSLLRSS